MSENVLALAAALSGPNADETVLCELCEAFETALELRLREDTARADCPGFDIAAALLAAASLKDAESGMDFTVGDVTIRSGSEAGDGMRRQAELIMAKYVPDGGFSFRGVAG